MDTEKTRKARRAEQIAMRQEMMEWVREQVNAGLSSKEIAAKLCMPESTVRLLRKTIEETTENS